MDLKKGLYASFDEEAMLPHFFKKKNIGEEDMLCEF
jgi:hypothetical protein